MRLRMLPPGAITEARQNAFFAGFSTAAALGLIAGAAVVAATPTELYRPAPATPRPTPAAIAPIAPRVALPPCTGTGKDCTEAEPDPVSGATNRVVPPLLPGIPPPAPQTDPQAGGGSGAVRALPEPGTLGLIAAGVAAIFIAKRRSA